MRPRLPFRVIAPREPKAIKPRKPKSAPRFIEHAHFGLGRVLAVRQVDGSADDYMADVKFADGTTRTLLLIQRVWISDIAGLIPEPPKPRLAPIKAEPVEEVRPDGLDGVERQTLEAAA
jgi:hypothetical protein